MACSGSITDRAKRASTRGEVAAVRPRGEESRCGPDAGDGTGKTLHAGCNADKTTERARPRRSRGDVHQAHDAHASAWQGGTCDGPPEASGADGWPDSQAARSPFGVGCRWQTGGAVGSNRRGSGTRQRHALEQCEAHEAQAGNNYYPYLWRFYQGHRSTLLRIWQALPFRSTTQEQSLETALALVLANEGSRAESLALPESSMNIDWVPDTWWRLVTGTAKRVTIDRVNRRYFELCVFSQIMWDLKSGDLCRTE